jgi:hypothetical protein
VSSINKLLNNPKEASTHQMCTNSDQNFPTPHEFRTLYKNPRRRSGKYKSGN